MGEGAEGPCLSGGVACDGVCWGFLGNIQGVFSAKGPGQGVLSTQCTLSLALGWGPP